MLLSSHLIRAVKYVSWSIMIPSYFAYLLLQIELCCCPVIGFEEAAFWTCVIKSPESNPTTWAYISAHLGSLDFINTRYCMSFQDKITFTLESLMNKSWASWSSGKYICVYLFQMRPRLNVSHVRLKLNSSRLEEVSGPESHVLSFSAKKCLLPAS